VRATIALARLIKARQPRLFAFCLSLRRKDRVARELGLPASIGEVRPFLHVSGQFGAARGCLAVMAPLAMHPVNKNELLAWDLSADPAELADLKPDDARARLFTRTADLPEGVTRLAVKGVHLNKSPIVISSLKTLDAAQAARWQIDLGTAEQNLQRLRALPDLSGLWAAVFKRPEAAAEVDVDEDLYGGFIGDADRRRLAQLRGLDPRELALSKTGFDDARLPELVLRYRARNFPETLTEQEAAHWQAHCRARLLDGQGGALTLTAYFDRIDQLAETAEDERSEAILGALYDWAEQLALE
jgi:exodeoxyribonuclease-1